MTGRFLKLGDHFINTDRILHVDFGTYLAKVVFEDLELRLDTVQSEALKRFLTEISLDLMSTNDVDIHRVRDFVQAIVQS